MKTDISWRPLRLFIIQKQNYWMKQLELLMKKTDTN